MSCAPDGRAWGAVGKSLDIAGRSCAVDRLWAHNLYRYFGMKLLRRR